MQKIFSFITNMVDSFRLNQEKEDFHVIADNIDSGVVFKGTNLWILVFAILICSLGLNVNSTAVVIGAMLVSPLMGPIIGLGFGIATSDIGLLKKALYNYLFAGIVAIVASTLYFALTPIHVAQTEMLSRTSPNIYDVLIAFFGGLAGIVAIASKMKGNVIPGVAIATALMPPLCTAGYGLATLQWSFFFGAFYLFFINTVFISLATLLTARLLKFPQKQQLDEKQSKRTNRIILLITILTIVPSIYFGYTMVQQDRYMQKAIRFVKSEIAKHPTKNSFLLDHEVNASEEIITLIYGGENISKEEIISLEKNLRDFDLEASKLDIQIGFGKKEEDEINPLAAELLSKEQKLQEVEETLDEANQKLDSIQEINELSGKIFKELKAQYESIYALSMQPSIEYKDSANLEVWLVHIKLDNTLDTEDETRIVSWLKERVGNKNIYIHYEVKTLNPLERVTRFLTP
ncbi:MAG: hypothetical protein CBB76_03530 [Crocinitomicaceae bacterium TMED16]|nr:MAG: hypothetical protein CBB76_03530 [Crocinitomicaceae bacterium TMED16]